MRSAEKAFLRLILLLGLRRGEAYAARWDRVDLENRVWTVPSLDRKLRKRTKALVPDLEVPLSELAVAELRQLQQATRRQRGRMFTLSIGRVGPDMKKATALGDVTVHDLRRSCSMGIERLGAPPHILALVLGHTRVPGAIASDLHYTLQRRPTEVREWLERWADHVGGLLAAAESHRTGRVLVFNSARSSA
jgi:integrase